MKKFIRWFIVMVLALGVVAAIVYAMLPEPVAVTTAEVTEGPLQVTVDEEGRTRIRERYVVSSPLMGRLRRITLDPGDTVVAEETVLAIIEPTDPSLLDARALAEAEARVRAAEAAVGRAGANLERARVDFEFARDEHARLIEAAERDAARPRELSEARTLEQARSQDYSAAKFAEEIARYELELAQSALTYAQAGEGDLPQLPVPSPIDGVVLRVLQESVAVVSPGTPLIEIGDAGDVEIVIDVLSTDAVRITPGDRVVVEHWGGDTSLEAVVRLVEPSAFTKVSALGIEEQRVNIIADFISPREDRATLRDGFRVEASIIVWEDALVLQVPSSAVFRHDGQWAAFVVRDGSAALQHVEVGRENGIATEILGGLSLGDRVIVHPGDHVADGAEVRERN